MLTAITFNENDLCGERSNYFNDDLIKYYNYTSFGIHIYKSNYFKGRCKIHDIYVMERINSNLIKILEKKYKFIFFIF